MNLEPGSDNPARPAPGVRLVELKKLRKHSALVLDFQKGDAWFSLLIARGDGDHVYAYENSCPHARSPLETFDGRVMVQQNRYLICAMHGASFRMEDGVCAGGPAQGTALAAIPVAVQDGWVTMR